MRDIFIDDDARLTQAAMRSRRYHSAGYIATISLLQYYLKGD